MNKEVSCTEDLLIYFCPFHFCRRLPLHHVIFFFFFFWGGGVNYKYINESFAFSSGEICRMIISSHVGFRLGHVHTNPSLTPHVHFGVLVFGTEPSETSISRYISAPRLFSDTFTSYCACVSSTSGILFFSPDNMSRMISYDVTAFDGFSLKAGPKCTNILVSNEKALVWTRSQCGIVQTTAWKKSRFDAFVNKNEDFSRSSHLCGSSLRSR